MGSPIATPADEGELRSLIVSRESSVNRDPFVGAVARILILVRIALACILAVAVIRMSIAVGSSKRSGESQSLVQYEPWVAPDLSEIPASPEGDFVRYGRELVAHTSRYLGPQGTVRHVSNGMNCQNCHLEAGTKPFAANYSAVASTYPRFRARSGTVEGFAKRINDCFERSLNGVALAPDSREMKAMIAYFKWLGKDVRRGEIPAGAGLRAPKELRRAASPSKGRANYRKHCATCHGEDGAGVKASDGVEWTYPPLWGPDSYNTGAGLYRLSRFAAFIKANMPYGAAYDQPVLTDEEAWDIAAFVNSMPRPVKNFPNDWPDLSAKPIDHPFGPYADSYPEEQHKYGPFQPIREAQAR